MLFALLDHLLHCADPDAAQGAQTEPEPLPLDGKVSPRLIDIGRIDRNVLFLHIDNVFCDLFDLVNTIIEDACQELFRVILFQIGRLIRDDRIGGGVRFVECIGGKALHLRKQLGAYFGRDPARGAAGNIAAFVKIAVNELVLLRHQFRAVLFGHGAAHEVCLSERVSRKVLEDLHDLLLIDDDTVSLFQNGFQERRKIGDLLRLGTVFQIGRNEIHGSGTIERDPRDQIFKAVGLKLFHKALHAALFKLEHRIGIPFADELIGALIVAFLSECDLFARVLFDIIERLFDIGKGRERQEVHFEHSDGLHFLHVELRGNIFAVSGKRHVVGDFFAADDNARGMHTGLARHAFKFQAHVNDALQRLVGLIDLNKFGIAFPLLVGKFFERFVMLILIALRFGDLFPTAFNIQSEQFADRGLPVHQFSNAIGIRIRDAHDAPDVFDDRSRCKRAECDDLRHIFRMIAAADIFDCLSAPLGTEIHVEVRHGNTVGIEEPLEEKIVSERIDVGDADRIGDNASDAGTTPRPHRDPVHARPVYVVPHDQEIVRKSHLDDDAQLIFGALHDLVRHGIVTFGKPLHRQPAQKFGRGRAVVRRVERDQRLIIDGRAVLLQIEGRVRVGDLVGNDTRIGNGFGKIGEECSHFIARFHVEFVRLHLHARRVVKRALGLNAHEDILHFPVFLVEVMHVVGRDEPDLRLPRQTDKKRQDLFLFGDPVILNLDIEILAECRFHVEREFFRFLVLPRH